MADRLEKAIIEIIDYSKDSQETLTNSVDAGTAEKSPCGKNCATCLKKKIRDAQPCTNNAAALAEARLSAQVPTKTSIAKIDSYNRTIKRYPVQFNPASLKLESNGNEIRNIGSVTQIKDRKEVKIEYGLLDVKIKLTVSLIFDQVNVQDSFLWEKFRPDSSNLLMGDVNLSLQNIENVEYTVQAQVDNFMNAIQSRSSREINFNWGRLHYHGILTFVKSEYKMFSVSGKPVNAEVTLVMECVNRGVNESSMGEWETYYDEVFCKEESLNLERGVQNVSNLFSIGY